MACRYTTLFPSIKYQAKSNLICVARQPTAPEKRDWRAADRLIFYHIPGGCLTVTKVPPPPTAPNHTSL